MEKTSKPFTDMNMKTAYISSAEAKMGINGTLVVRNWSPFCKYSLPQPNVRKIIYNA